MSTGTNKERITQNNGIINENNSDLTALKTRINNLPTSGDTTATANDIALGKTAVSKGVKITGTYTPPTVSLQSKDVTINQNGTTTITADTGYDGLSDVDVTVSGILDTSDANATANDMAYGKTAYVNNQKLTGTVYNIFGGSYVNINYYNYSNDTSHSQYIIRGRNEIDRLYRAYTYPAVNIPYNTLATIVGAEASKIKKDEVICGVTGTYEGTKAVLPDGIKFRDSTATNMDWLGDVDTSNITNASSLFSNNKMLTIPLLDTSNVTTMESMFYGCTSLTEIPLIDTSNVTTMESMFFGCTSLTEIPLIDTSNVTTMGSMFYDCMNLTEIPLLDTSNVTTMKSMFNGCTSLTEIPLIDTSNVTTMSAMFFGCTNLQTIPLMNTSNVKNLNQFVQGCRNLSDESLNNILAMCIATGTKVFSTYRTLKNLSLTQTQAETCQTLSNWDAFVAAGWSSGYTS